MKSLISIFIFSFCLNFIQAQNSNFKKIDSLHKYVVKSKINDSLGLAKVHYQLGELYRYSNLSDSSYFYYHKAERFYRHSRQQLEYAKTLYGIAVIQTYEKDHTGSEVTSFQAITILENLKQVNEVRKYKAYIYNNLGIVFNQLNQLEESVNYYTKAIDLKRGLKGNFKSSIDNSINNLARVYVLKNEHDKAIKYYNIILSDKSLRKERPSFYALVLGNYGKALFNSGNYDRLPNLYFEALKIADSVDFNGYNSIIINQQIAEYYNLNGDNELAKFYAYKAKSISEKFNNEDLLSALLLLSRIESKDKALKHLKAYVKLNDSLLKTERTIRNKFERIRFETKEIEKENIQIARERLWLLIISCALILASVLLYLVINQRSKNKELKFVQQQQETNEEIYNLMLSQQDNIEEARVLEKKRISEELHDGVLGRLFGARLSLDSLNMGTTADAINTRSKYIAQLKTIEEDIRKVSHELNTDFVSGSGFIDIIKSLIDTQTLAYQLKYKMNNDGAINWDGISNKNKIHIYRIIQEALHNIYKHAKATEVVFTFKLKKSIICLKIKDNGAGFDINKAKFGIGLKNMNSRIAEINGIIYFNSEKNRGTTVVIEIPIT